tara:strand:- start:904 stop:1023 length:120 start_codon:yes stop_codon:yes gene_type:complete
MKVELLDMLDQLAFGPEHIKEEAHDFLYDFIVKLDINKK